jgi:hypothetical protein
MISGERIQELCDVYCGLLSDFEYNPRIRIQTEKHLHLDRISEPWKNPRVIFCYTHRLDEFMQILPFIENEFILVSHNSDGNVTEKYLPLVQDPKLVFWHAQNVLFNHPKLGSLPIGIANSMWPHGNQEIISDVIAKNHTKTHSVFFNFSVHTNPSERIPCYEALKDRLVWQPTVGFQEYLETMATYKYAICPPGNGIDCHRIWECIYLGVIPILLRSPFSEKLNARFPCIRLDTWNNLEVNILLEKYLPPTYSMKEVVDCIKENNAFF